MGTSTMRAVFLPPLLGLCCLASCLNADPATEMAAMMMEADQARIAAKESIHCVDDNEECSGWAEDGECEKNAEYMLETRKKSCGVCGTTEGQEASGTPDEQADVDADASANTEAVTADPQ